MSSGGSSVHSRLRTLRWIDVRIGFSKPSPSFQVKFFSKKGGRCLLAGCIGEPRLGFRFTMSGSSKEPYRLRIGRTEAKKRCSLGEVLDGLLTGNLSF